MVGLLPILIAVTLGVVRTASLWVNVTAILVGNGIATPGKVGVSLAPVAARNGRLPMKMVGWIRRSCIQSLFSHEQVVADAR